MACVGLKLLHPAPFATVSESCINDLIDGSFNEFLTFDFIKVNFENNLSASAFDVGRAKICIAKLPNVSNNLFPSMSSASNSLI